MLYWAITLDAPSSCAGRFSVSSQDAWRRPKTDSRTVALFFDAGTLNNHLNSQATLPNILSPQPYISGTESHVRSRRRSTIPWRTRPFPHAWATVLLAARFHRFLRCSTITLPLFWPRDPKVIRTATDDNLIRFEDPHQASVHYSYSPNESCLYANWEPFYPPSHHSRGLQPHDGALSSSRHNADSCRLLKRAYVLVYM